MTEADIANALGQHLASPSIGTVIWENRDAEPARPYLVFEVVRADTTDETLAGGAARHSGFMQVTVVSDTDQFATISLGIADSIAARFPYGLRLAITGGHVSIIKPPSIKQGYPDGIYWRTPVRVDYLAVG